MKYPTSQQGFVILFAVLVSAIILLIGAGILAISVKESILASAARESQYAINAADAGLECVLYDDIQPSGEINTNGWVNCAGFGDASQLVSNSATLRFYVTDPVSGHDTCALVTRKTNTQAPPPSLGTGYESVVVVSRGFNICDGPQPAFNDPLLVERVMRATYFKPAP